MVSKIYKNVFKSPYVAHNCNPIVWEAELGESRILGHPLSHSTVEIGPGYIRPWLRNKKIEN